MQNDELLLNECQSIERLDYLSAWLERPRVGAFPSELLRRERVRRKPSGAHNDHHRGDRESGEDDDDDVNGFFFQFEHKRSDSRVKEREGRGGPFISRSDVG